MYAIAWISADLLPIEILGTFVKSFPNYNSFIPGNKYENVCKIVNILYHHQCAERLTLRFRVNRLGNIDVLLPKICNKFSFVIMSW